jgi:hypothetical protein
MTNYNFKSPTRELPNELKIQKEKRKAVLKRVWQNRARQYAKLIKKRA